MTPSKERRILFAVGRLWGDEGITTQLMTLTEQLSARGWRIGLVAGMDPEQHDDHSNLQWLDEHTDAFYAPFPEVRFSLSTIGKGIQSFVALKRAVDRFRPDVLHYHSLSLSPFLFLLRLFYDLPVVATCHIEFADDRRDVDIASIINAVMPSYLGDRVIAISERMKAIFASDLRVPPDRIERIPHGVDDDHFRPPSPEERSAARNSFGLDAEDAVVCLVGRLDPIKGHEVLFRALRHLQEQGQPVHAICAGTGGFEDTIRQQAAEHGVADQVLFPGFVDARTVYWASDINVLPSYREGFALVVPEAMLCGRPTIRTPAAGAQEQIEDGQNGFLIPFDAPRELADRIRTLLDHPDERRRMGQAAAKTAAKRFTLERSMDETEALYESLIEESGPSHASSE